MKRLSSALLILIVVGAGLISFIPHAEVHAFTGSGSGTSEDPYVITTVTQLQEMENDKSAYYVLGNNIDASATSGWNGGAGFDPIGQVGRFTGELDGQGYTISDLYIYRPAEVYVGLFGDIQYPANLVDILLEDVDITGQEAVGALAGRTDSASSGTTISGCTSSGEIYFTAINGGGLVGDADNCVITSCSSSCDVSIGTQCGGFVGGATGCTISNCSASGDVAFDSTICSLSVISQIGGFTGYLYMTEIDVCYATGSVTGDYDETNELYAGGFVGETYRGVDIQNCYARGSVDAEDDGDATKAYAGGFVGYMDYYSGSASDIEDCYSTGYVVDNTYNTVGGFCTERETGDTITTSFWDTETSNQSSSDGATGKTTTQMKTEATFTDDGWNFTSIWGIDETINDGYPFFMPIVTTNAATDIDQSSGTLNGTITFLGEGCNIRGFQWGTSPSVLNYDWYETGSFTTGSYSRDLVGLVAGQTYYFRAFAGYGSSYSYGSTLNFTTTGSFTGTSLLWAEAISATEIVLNWIPLAGSSDTMVRYSDDHYPASYADESEAYFGSYTTYTLGGLSSGTTYWFRAWAYSDAGEFYSDDYIGQAIATTWADIPNPTIDPPSGGSGSTPDASAHSGEAWYTLSTWFAGVYHFESTGMWLRVFGGLTIAMLSILIAYGSGSLVITIGSVIIMNAIAHIFGIVPFYYVVGYGIVAGGVAYTKGNSYA